MTYRYQCDRELLPPRSLSLRQADLGNGFLSWWTFSLRRDAIDPWFRLFALRAWLHRQGCVTIPGFKVVFLSTWEWPWSDSSLGCVRFMERVIAVKLSNVYKGWSPWSQVTRTYFLWNRLVWLSHKNHRCLWLHCVCPTLVNVVSAEGLQRYCWSSSCPLWGLSDALYSLWEIFDPSEEKVSFHVGAKDT